MNGSNSRAQFLPFLKLQPSRASDLDRAIRAGAGEPRQAPVVAFRSVAVAGTSTVPISLTKKAIADVDRRDQIGRNQNANAEINLAGENRLIIRECGTD